MRDKDGAVGGEAKKAVGGEIEGRKGAAPCGALGWVWHIDIFTWRGMYASNSKYVCNRVTQKIPVRAYPLVTKVCHTRKPNYSTSLYITSTTTSTTTSTATITTTIIAVIVTLLFPPVVIVTLLFPPVDVSSHDTSCTKVVHPFFFLRQFFLFSGAPDARELHDTSPNKSDLEVTKKKSAKLLYSCHTR